MKSRTILKTLGTLTVGGFATYGAIQAYQQHYQRQPNDHRHRSSLFDTTDQLLQHQLAAIPFALVNKWQDKVDSNIDVVENSTQQNTKTNFTKQITASLESLERWRTIQSIPGYVIGVSVRGHTAWIHGGGFADLENGTRCTPDTVMRIASISKSITAALLMKLVQEGKLDLDVPIRKYLTPEQWPDKYWEGKPVDITLRQLAAHLGGIRHYKKESKEEFESPEYYLQKNFKTVTDSLTLFKDDPLVAKPGTKYNYTTFGWTLISAVIESVLEKKDFAAELQRFLHRDLGMQHTVLDYNEPIIPHRARYYHAAWRHVKNLQNNASLRTQLENVPYVDNSYKWAGGGLLSNVGDLLRFGNIMLYSYKGGDHSGKPGFIEQKFMREMWTSAPATLKKNDDNGNGGGGGALSKTGYGIGFAVTRDGKNSTRAFTAEQPFENLFSHSGGAIGASSMLMIEPEHEIVLALIVNVQQAGGLWGISMDVLKNFANDETVAEVVKVMQQKQQPQPQQQQDKKMKKEE